MSTEHIYTWAMIQLTLVLLLASTRLQPANNDKKSLSTRPQPIRYSTVSGTSPTSEVGPVPETEGEVWIS